MFTTILSLYRNISVRENPYSSIFYAVVVHARVSNYACNKELRNKCRPFNILYYAFPREMNGNSLVFNCIDIRSKLRLNVTFYIVSKINLVSGFYNILVSFIFTSALIRSGSKRI